jgi:hypothetical protein
MRQADTSCSTGGQKQTTHGSSDSGAVSSSMRACSS